MLQAYARLAMYCEIGFASTSQLVFEEEAGHMEQLDDRICAQFPLAGNLLGRTATFQLRALESFAAVIEVHSGNAKMECVVILKTGAPFFIKGRLNKLTRSPFN